MVKKNERVTDVARPHKKGKKGEKDEATAPYNAGT
jgi:hypothetical protein